MQRHGVIWIFFRIECPILLTRLCAADRCIIGSLSIESSLSLPLDPVNCIRVVSVVIDGMILIAANNLCKFLACFRLTSSKCLLDVLRPKVVPNVWAAVLAQEVIHKLRADPGNGLDVVFRELFPALALKLSALLTTIL